MGTLTLSMKTEDEQLLRKLAKERYGETKGAMSRVVTDALKKVEHTEEAWITYARKGVRLGTIDLNKLREEMYDRTRRV